MACVAALAALGAGIGMWNTVAPGEERKREILKVINPKQGHRVSSLRLLHLTRRNRPLVRSAISFINSGGRD